MPERLQRQTPHAKRRRRRRRLPPNAQLNWTSAADISQTWWRTERTETSMEPESATAAAAGAGALKAVEERDEVVIRFAGDSGDGMQLAGMHFTNETALAGNDLSTLPDF